MLICPLLSRIQILALLILSFLTLHSESLGAQGLPAASKEAALSFFGAYSRVNTDRSSQKDNGFTVGFAYTRYLHWLLTPSLEVRCKIATGSTVSEKTFGGGIRVEHPFKISTRTLISLAVTERLRLPTPSPQFRGRAIITMIPPCTPPAAGSITTSLPPGPHVSTTSMNIGILG